MCAIPQEKSLDRKKEKVDNGKRIQKKSVGKLVKKRIDLKDTQKEKKRP